MSQQCWGQYSQHKVLKFCKIKHSLKWLRSGRSRPLCSRRHGAAWSYKMSRIVKESRFLWIISGVCPVCFVPLSVALA